MPLKGQIRPHHARMLKDPDIRRWHENLARGSKARADICLRRLGAFCLAMKKTPAEIARWMGAGESLGHSMGLLAKILVQGSVRR